MPGKTGRLVPMFLWALNGRFQRDGGLGGNNECELLKASREAYAFCIQVGHTIEWVLKRGRVDDKRKPSLSSRLSLSVQGTPGSES